MIGKNFRAVSGDWKTGGEAKGLLRGLFLQFLKNELRRIVTMQPASNPIKLYGKERNMSSGPTIKPSTKPRKSFRSQK